MGRGNLVLGDHHGDGAGYSCRAAAGAERRGDQYGDILAQRLGHDVPCRARQVGVIAGHLGLATEDVDVDRGAATATAGGNRRGERAVHHRAVGLRQQTDVAGRRDRHAVVVVVLLQFNAGVGVGDENAQRTGQGEAGARRGRGGGDDGDQLFIVDRLDVHVFRSIELRVRADDSLGNRFVDGHVQRAARGHFAGCAGNARGDQQQVFVGVCGHVQLAVGGFDLGIVTHHRLGLVVRHNHVQRAADGVAAGAAGDRRRDGEQLGVRIDARVLDVVSSRVDHDVLVLCIALLAAANHAAAAAGGGGRRNGDPADFALHVVVIDQQRNVQARGAAGSGIAQRAGDHAGVGAAVGVHGHAAVLALFEIALDDIDFRRADPRIDLILEGEDREGAGAGELGVRAAVDGTGNRFYIIVGAGEEVQQVHCLEQVLAGDFDLDGIALAVLGLLQVDDAGLGVFARVGGIGDQAVHAPGHLVVVDGHHLLVGEDGQLRAVDCHAVADAGFDLVLADDDREGRAYADAGALRDADAAGADGHLALVGCLHGDVLALDHGVVAHRGGGLGLAHQHGDRARDGGLAAAAADRAGQGLRRHKAGVAPGSVLREGGGDVHVAPQRLVRVFGLIVFGLIIAVDGARQLGVGLVAVHADGHAHGDGVGIGGQGHGGAGAQRTEVAVVDGHDVRAVGGVDAAGHMGVGDVLADGHAHGRRHLHLLLLLLRAVRTHRLTDGAARAVCAGGVVDVAVALRGVGLVLHVLRPQGVGGEGGIAAGGLRVGAVLALAIAVLVQLIVDPVARGVVRLPVTGALALVVAHVVVDRAFGHHVGLFFGSGFRGLDLVGVTLHVRAHGSGERVRLVLAAAGGGDVSLALLQGRRAEEVGRDLGADDVHGNRRAHRSLAADGEAAGVGQRLARLVRRHDQVSVFDLRFLVDRLGMLLIIFGVEGFEDLRRYDILSFVRVEVLLLRVLPRLVPVEVVLLHRHVVFLVRLFPRRSGGLRAGLQGIRAGGREDRADADLGVHAAVQQVDRRGSVDGDVLAVGAAARRSVVIAAGQRIGARHAGGLHVALRLGADLDGAGLHLAVRAQDGLGGQIAIGEGERRADTHGLTLAVGGLRGGRRARHAADAAEGRRRHGAFEVHLDGDRNLAVCREIADVHRDEQREAAIRLADADRAGLLFVVLVLVGQGDRGRQLVQLVGDQLALQLVRVHDLHLAAGDGGKGEGAVDVLIVDLGRPRHEAFLNTRRLGDVLESGVDRGDLPVGHVEAVDHLVTLGVVDHDDLFGLGLRARRVGIGQLLDLLVLGKLDRHHDEVADLALGGAIGFIFLALHLHGGDDLVVHLGGRSDGLQVLLKDDVEDDVLVVGVDRARRDDPEFTVFVHRQGVFTLLAVALNIGILHFRRKLVAFLRDQLDGLAGTGLGDLGGTAHVGLDVVQRRDKLHADVDLQLIRADVRQIAHAQGHRAGAGILVFVRACGAGDLHLELNGLLRAILVGIGDLHLLRQAVLRVDRQGQRRAAAFGTGVVDACAAVGGADVHLVFLLANLPGVASVLGRLLVLVLLADGLGFLASLAVGSVLLRGSAVAGVGVGFALGVLRAGCGGDHLLVVLGVERQSVVDLDVAGGALGRQVFDDRLGSAVDDGHGHAAGDADVGRACARDGLGADDVLAGQVLRLQLHIQPLSQHIQRAGGQRQARVLHAGLQLGLHLIGQFALADEGDELLQVHHLVFLVGRSVRFGLGEQQVDDVVTHAGEGLLDEVEHHGLELFLVLVDDDRVVEAGNDSGDRGVEPAPQEFHALVLGVLQSLGEHALDPGTDGFAVNVLAAEAVLDGLQQDVAQLGDGGLEDLFTDVFHRHQRAVVEGLLEVVPDILGFALAVQRREHALAEGRVHDGGELLIIQLVGDVKDIFLQVPDPGVPGIAGEVRVGVDVEQLLEARAVQQGGGQLVDGIGDDARNAAGDLVAVLEQAHLVEQVGDLVGEQLAQALDQLGFFALAFLFFLFLFLGLVLHDGAHIQRVGFDAGIVHDGPVVDVQHVDGHRDAHADGAAGGGGVGLDPGLRAVQGDDAHRAVHALLIRLIAVLGIDGWAAHGFDQRNLAVLGLANGGFGVVLVDVQREARRHGDAALAGLRALAVGVLAEHATGGNVVAAVDAGQARAAADHVVRLAVGLAVVAVGIAGRGALGAGVGDALDRALGLRAHVHAGGRHAAREHGSGGVVDDADVEAAARGHLVARGAGVGLDLMRGLVAGKDHHVLQRVGICGRLQLGLGIERQGRATAQSGLGVVAVDVQRQHGRDRHAACGTGLGGYAIGHLLLGDHVDAVERSVAGKREVGLVRDERHRVRTGDSHGDARAHAGGRGFLSTGGIRPGAEGHVCARAHIQAAAGEDDLGLTGLVADLVFLVDLRVGLGGGDVHAHRAADTDVAGGIAGSAVQRGLRGGSVRLDGDARALDIAALDEGIVLALYDGHTHANARADRSGLRVIGAQLERGLDPDLRRIGRSRGHLKGVVAVGALGTDDGLGRGAVLNDGLDRIRLDAIARVRGLHRSGQDAVGAGARRRADRAVRSVGRKRDLDLDGLLLGRESDLQLGEIVKASLVLLWRSVRIAALDRELAAAADLLDGELCVGDLFQLFGIGLLLISLDDRRRTADDVVFRRVRGILRAFGGGALQGDDDRIAIGDIAHRALRGKIRRQIRSCAFGLLQLRLQDGALRAEGRRHREAVVLSVLALALLLGNPGNRTGLYDVAVFVLIEDKFDRLIGIGRIFESQRYFTLDSIAVLGGSLDDDHVAFLERGRRNQVAVDDLEQRQAAVRRIRRRIVAIAFAAAAASGGSALVLGRERDGAGVLREIDHQHQRRAGLDLVDAFGGTDIQNILALQSTRRALFNGNFFLLFRTVFIDNGIDRFHSRLFVAVLRIRGDLKDVLRIVGSVVVGDLIDLAATQLGDHDGVGIANHENLRFRRGCGFGRSRRIRRGRRICRG